MDKGILLKGNIKEGIYTLKKTTNGWVLEGEDIAYAGFDVDDTPEVNAELRADFLKHQYEAALKEIEKLKANRPSGTYINSNYNHEWYAIEATCNLCGERWMGSRNFCPNCGAQMKGADDEM